MLKNLLIYINPSGFDQESEKLAKIQIENSLELGWRKQNIIFVTNFPFSYEGIESIILNKGYFEYDPESSKIFALAALFQNGFFGQDLYWLHDLDAYQLETITEEELELDNFDAGFTDYCRIPQWNLGSIFFKKSADDIFANLTKLIKPKLDKDGKPFDDGTPLDEMALCYLTNNNVDGINQRIKKLNNRYNFGLRRIDYCFEKATKPLKVIHFHPQNPRHNTLAIAMHGKNRLKMPLMNERLIKIFKKHGYS